MHHCHHRVRSMLPCLFAFTLSLWLVSKKLTVCFLESFKQDKEWGLGRKAWFSPDSTPLPGWCNNAPATTAPLASWVIVGNINDRAVHKAPELLLLLSVVVSLHDIMALSQRDDVMVGFQLPSPNTISHLPPPQCFNWCCSKTSCSPWLSGHCLRQSSQTLPTPQMFPLLQRGSLPKWLILDLLVLFDFFSHKQNFVIKYF